MSVGENFSWDKRKPSAVDPTISPFVMQMTPNALMQSGFVSWLRRLVRSKSMFFVRFLACLTILMCMVTPAAAAAERSTKATNFMRVHGQALPPYGFVHFCQRHRKECAANDEVQLERFDAAPQRLSELQHVNRKINRLIKPITDLALYGQEEYWTIPTQQGDCEDYVVLKRRILMRRGWPASALLITVVLDEQGDGHAVLTVRTKQGDYVLDNKQDDVLVWNKTPYTYLMRQSYLNPQLWMALDPRSGISANTVAGLNSGY